MEYAYAKLQGLSGQSFYIQNLPTKICRKNRRDKEEVKTGNDTIFISESSELALCHALVSYDDKMASFFLIPFGGIYIDNQLYQGVRDSDQIINDFFAKPPRNVEAYESVKIKLNNYAKIHFPVEDVDVPLVFYLILPKTGNSNLLKKESESVFTPAKMTNQSSKSKIPDKLLSSKWSMDDKEQLKKYILIYGYGRWKQIQEASRGIGGKLKERPISEIRAFANAFLRCIVENLNYDQNELRKFLLTIIEEFPDDPYIIVNSKDWDINLIRQRANPWAKRIQLLGRVRMLIKKFKNEQRKNPKVKKSKDMQWENLLNFLPSSVFYGQRPSVWWTKKHDVDLLRGTYKYGYANYPQMKADPEYSFNELEKTSSFSEFPNADTITRRLKKLIQSIVKLEQNDGKLDFEGLSENELEGWETDEKKKLFKFLSDYGVPLNSEGKSSWMELREKYANYLGTGSTNKNISEIEKFVQKIRIKCQQVIENKGDSKIEDEFSDINISQEDAQKFNKNTNMLQFIRKNILLNSATLFKAGLEELVKATNEIHEGKTGYVPPKYECEKHDKSLLSTISDNGFHALEKLSNNPNLGFEGIKMSVDQAISRLEYICEFYKNYLDRTSTKKRKSDKPFKDDGKKKQKFQLNKDSDGNIVFPLVINNSLTLLDCGRISTNPNYHSEHNLFPIGYKSVRSYASIFEKGKKAQYTCEILEGSDGKPLYRLTSSEDPNNPIVRDSSTGCWVYICSKVNDMADVKKQKVTISGTERFGLLEANICRILENLPEAEKCTKYKFKYRIVNPTDEVE